MHFETRVPSFPARIQFQALIFALFAPLHHPPSQPTTPIFAGNDGGPGVLRCESGTTTSYKTRDGAAPTQSTSGLVFSTPLPHHPSSVCRCFSFISFWSFPVVFTDERTTNPRIRHGLDESGLCVICRPVEQERRERASVPSQRCCVAADLLGWNTQRRDRRRASITRRGHWETKTKRRRKTDGRDRLFCC